MVSVFLFLVRVKLRGRHEYKRPKLFFEGDLVMRMNSCLFALLAVGFMTCTSFAQTPLIYYDFEEGAGLTVTDEIGGIVGNLTDFPGDNSQWVTGAPGGFSPGGGLDFGSVDGNDYIRVPGFPIDNTTIFTSNYSMSVWFKADNTGDHFIFSQDTAGIHNGIRGGGKVHTAHWSSDFSGATTITPGQWHHAAWTFEYPGPRDATLPGNAKVYLDGVLDGSFRQRAINEMGNELFIGSRHEDNRFWIGVLDDAAIWDVILAPNQIKHIADGGDPRVLPVGVFPPPPPTPTYDFSGAQDLQGWTVLNGAANFTGGDGGGVGPADAGGGRAHDNAHVTFLMESPEIFLDFALQPGDVAMVWVTAGGAGDQANNGPDFANPAQVLAFNGGQSNEQGEKGLAFLNVSTGQYDAVFFNQGNGGTDTYTLTLADLIAAGVDPSQIYKLQYYENDQVGWGWGQLNSIDIRLGNPIPEPSTLVLATLGLLGLFGCVRRRRHRA